MLYRSHVDYDVPTAEARAHVMNSVRICAASSSPANLDLGKIDLTESIHRPCHYFLDRRIKWLMSVLGSIIGKVEEVNLSHARGQQANTESQARVQHAWTSRHVGCTMTSLCDLAVEPRGCTASTGAVELERTAGRPGAML